jgi:hypothetical protein
MLDWEGTGAGSGIGLGIGLVFGMGAANKPPHIPVGWEDPHCRNLVAQCVFPMQFHK